MTPAVLRHALVFGVLALPLPLAALAQTAPSPELAGEPALAFDEGRYRLGYDIYLASGNLPAAYRVAEKAVRERPQDPAWRRRLAQAAQWLGQPATALQNWLALARMTGDPAAWREVGRTAPMLADDEAWLSWQQYEAKTHPQDATRINALLSAFERVGRPQEGLDYLAALQRRHPGRALLEAESLLAERTGQDDRALADLELLTQRYGYQEGWLLRAAGLHYQRGELLQAHALLARADAQMPDSAAGFWQTRAELARLLGDERAALAAYVRLQAGGGESESDLINYAALLQERDPLAAARLQVLLFKRFGRVESAHTALYLWLRENQLPAAETFLQGLDADQRARLESSAAFLELRGRLHEGAGRWRLAMADYAAGRRLDPSRQSLQQAWLSLLIEHGRPAELRRLLLEGEAMAVGTPAFWGIWAAGWNRLEQPVRALPYLQAIYKKGPDNMLNALAYADGLSRAGLVDAAAGLQRQVWEGRALAAGALPASERQALEQALLALELARLPADAGRQRLRTLIRQQRVATGPISPWLRDTVLAAAWASDSSDSQPADVLQRLPAKAAPPAWSPLLQALTDQDETALSQLLAQRPDELPVYDRVEAAERLGRFDLAASLAFDTAELQPDDDEMHRRLQERVWSDAGWLDLSFQHDQQGSLTRTPRVLAGKIHLDGNTALGLRIESAGLSSDPAVLRLPVDSQQRYELGISRKDARHEAELALTAFDSLDTVPGLRGRVSSLLRAGVLAEIRGGLQQPTTLTSGLSVGGQRDFAGAGLAWAISGRDTLALDLEYSQLAAQGGGALGTTWTNALSVSHRLFSGERDWVLKTGISNTRSNTEAILPDVLKPLLPVGVNAGPDYFVPAAFTQFSLALAFGENAEQSFQRGWRSFWEAGLTQDAETGLGYAYRLGVLGRVLGRDRLRFFVSGADGAQGNGEVTQTFNADYRFWY